MAVYHTTHVSLGRKILAALSSSFIRFRAGTACLPSLQSYADAWQRTFTSIYPKRITHADAWQRTKPFSSNYLTMPGIPQSTSSNANARQRTNTLTSGHQTLLDRRNTQKHIHPCCSAT
eukprot:scaffold50967_cov19-Tisochrysis_lutea.AAC.8